MPESILHKELLEAAENETDDHKILGYLSKYARTFLLCPTFMNKTGDLPELEWKTISYDIDLYDLPRRKGVYAFSVVADHGFLPQNSYIMYVGKAGDVDTDNTIKKRYRNYCTQSGLADRPKVKRLISLFGDHLKYHYAIVPDDVCTEDIEHQLTKIFVPPFNVSDFEADVKELLKGINIL